MNRSARGYTIALNVTQIGKPAASTASRSPESIPKIVQAAPGMGRAGCWV